jgi:hypothetical protein
MSTSFRRRMIFFYAHNIQQVGIGGDELVIELIRRLRYEITR